MGNLFKQHKKTAMRNLILLTIGLLFGFGLQGQTQTRVKKNLNTWTVGVNAGHLYDLLVTSKDGSQASGDLKGLSGTKTNFDLGYGLYVEKQFNPLFGLQLGLNGGNITGANELEYYEGSFTDFNLNMTFNFSNLGLLNMDSPWNLYSKAGLGLMSYSSERFLNFDDASNNSEENSVLSSNFGLGLRYQINNKWRLEIQSNYKAVFNDGFDGWDYGSGADQFIYSSVGVAYTFGNRKNASMEQVNFFSDQYLNISSKTIESVQQIDTIRIAQLEQQLEEEEMKSAKQEELLNQQKTSLQLQDERLKKLENQSRSISISRSIFFIQNSSVLTKEAKEELTSLSIVLASNEETKIRITAFTDKYGDEDYNAKLRERRAAIVEKFLMENLSVAQSRIEKQTKDQIIKGESIQSLNRRVDLELF